jgi:penicillin V acylase-like amidase (Ntn superfamily)
MIEYFLGFTADILFGITAYWADNIYYNQEMVKEIHGVSKGCGVPFGKLVFINFVYEFTTIHMKLCSSILIRNSTGSILHGRNMDFFLWNRFSPLVAQV